MTQTCQYQNKWKAELQLFSRLVDLPFSVVPSFDIWKHFSLFKNKHQQPNSLYFWSHSVHYLYHLVLLIPVTVLLFGKSTGWIRSSFLSYFYLVCHQHTIFLVSMGSSIELILLFDSEFLWRSFVCSFCFKKIFISSRHDLLCSILITSFPVCSASAIPRTWWLPISNFFLLMDSLARLSWTLTQLLSIFSFYSSWIFFFLVFLIDASIMIPLTKLSFLPSGSWGSISNKSL